MSRPPGSPFPERYDTVLAMKLAGRTNRQIKEATSLNRNQLSSIIFRLREEGRLERSQPKIARPRTQTLHKLKKPPRITVGPGKPIYMLMDRECRWPVGNDKAGVHLFCAAQTDNGSYCATHHGKGVQVR